MTYIKKGGWGGNRPPKKRVGGLKGRRCKHADYVKLMNDMMFKKPHAHLWKKQTYREHPVCPICDNEDGEKITQLRERFYKCELCLHHWDMDLSRLKR